MRNINLFNIKHEKNDVLKHYYNMKIPNFKIGQMKCDVLIVGAGGSGMMSSFYLSNSKKKVVIISKVHPLQSHTIAAQGGINAALGNVTIDDWRWHMYDTVKGSDWLGDQDAIELMCKEAKEAIKDLVEIGVEFCQDDKGNIMQKTYGGQTLNFGQGGLAYRSCSSTDRTGYNILNSIYNQILLNGVEILNYYYAIELIIYNNQCYGVIALNIKDGAIHYIIANDIIIATGGYSQIYSTTTSAKICTGDGNSLVLRAGLMLQDMEFIQFHPTAMKNAGILVTEAARSYGGKLLNCHGERFMEKYSPMFMELTSRDIIARAISMEIALGNGCGPSKDHVFLDMTGLSYEFMHQYLPTMVENCKKFLKIDPNKQKIPVTPAAHYTMGGIPTNIYCQVINFSGNNECKVKGLWCIGEAACISVHGANRLGCNSLLDLIVFAKVVSKQILLVGNILPDIIDLGLFYQKMPNFISKFGNSNSKFKITDLRKRMQQVMQKNVSIFRNAEMLNLAQEELNAIKAELALIKIEDYSLQWNYSIVEYLEFENMLALAEVTINSALARKESRGSHYRQDFPERDDCNFLYHSLCGYKENGNVTMAKRKVRFNTSPLVNSFLPEKR